LEFRSLPGLQPYEKIRQLQQELIQSRYEDLIPDTVLFLEHTPVVTRGRGLQFTGVQRARHMPLELPLAEGTDFAESERGGDLTYHGPGQLVIYPICKLDGKGFGPDHDVVGFLRKLENVLIRILADRGVQAGPREEGTGVWIGDRKVASMGIAVRKWVTYHGIAINCVNDLSPFQQISPCGFSPEVMTRLSEWIPLGPDWRAELEQAWMAAMERET
jgi:lipoate-protein ligase B